MAHKVKCLYCGVTFDRDKTPCEQVSAKRYAHIECSKQVQEKVINRIQNIIDGK